MSEWFRGVCFGLILAMILREIGCWYLGRKPAGAAPPVEEKKP
jgi:hypothetical protein